MPEAGSIKVGNAWIKITPELDHAQLKAQLDRAEKEIAAFTGDTNTLARQSAKLREQLENYVTIKYGEEAAKRVKLEQAASAKRQDYNKTETAAHIRAISTVTEAKAKSEQAKTAAAEKAARQRERVALNARNLEIRYGAEVAASYRKDVAAMMKESKGLSLVRINEAKQWSAADIVEQRKVAAEQLKQTKAREAQVKAMTALVVRQAQLEAAESVKAARTAQAAYTAAHNARQAQILTNMSSLKAASIAAAQGQVAAAQAAKRASQQTIAANDQTVRALQDNAKKASKSWTKAMYSAGTQVNAIGTSMSEFGRNIQRNITTPLLGAAAAMSAMGISAADSLMRAQTALQGMGVSAKDTSKQINTLEEYGTQTPYAVGDMFTYAAQYTRSGMSNGLNSKEASTRATSLVQSIGDLAAYAGITDPEMVKRTLVAVGNIQEADRASLRNVRTLAQSAGFDIPQLAKVLGFKDRPYTEKEITDRREMMEAKGVDWEVPNVNKASSQMMDWMQNAKDTGGIPGESIVSAILEQAEKVAGTGTDESAAVKQGSATITARLANMWESSKFGLADLFVSPTGKDGAYEYSGAGAAIMGKGGLLDSLTEIGKDLQGPSSKVVTELFENLTILTGWVKDTVKYLKEHEGFTDMLIEAGKWAVLLGGGAIVLGSLIKLFGALFKLASPLAGILKGAGKTGKGASKIVGQATGLGTETDAQKEAKAIQREAKREAKELRKDAKKRSDPRERTADRLHANWIEADGRRRAAATRAQGQTDTSWRDRYQQRRANINGGDNRALGQRAIDSVRGRNSQVEEIQVNTDKAKQKINELETEIEGLRTKIRNFRGENFNELAEHLAGADPSVKAAAEKAAKAVREADTAATNLKGLKLSALEGEFNRVTEDTSALKSQVSRAASNVSDLNGQGLGGLDGELTDAKGKSKSLDTALGEAAKQVGNLNGKSLGKVKGQVDHVKDAADAASGKVGGGKSSLITRVGQLNGMSTGSVVKQVNKLKDALNNASGKANTLNSRLNDISNHAPGGGSNKKNNNRRALGGVLPGYTPGQDVHHFTSPTGGSLHLSGGEAVMRPEWTAAVGPGYVNHMNQLARTKGAGAVQKEMKFAKGGILGKLGLDEIVAAAGNYNVGRDVRGAASAVSMYQSSDALGGDTEKGMKGAGRRGNNFIGSDVGRKTKGMYDFISTDVFELLKKAPVPSGVGQVIGVLGGALAPVQGQYFWDDVWKGEGNVLERGQKYMSDILSMKTLKSVVDNLFGGTVDTLKSLWKGGTAFLADPVGMIKEGVNGIWEMSQETYNGFVDMVKGMREIYQNPLSYGAEVAGEVFETAKENLPNLTGLFDFSGDGLKSGPPDVSKILEGAGSSVPGVGDSVSRWTPQVKMVLAQLGLPASDLALVLHRIKVESGGNPKAINNWDINAKNGTPSQGLMQTIPGTFAAYAGPYKSRGITDPLASIYAGLNYATSRYGANWRKALSGTKGYATGTDGAARGWAWVGEEGPELVNFSGGETVLTHEDSVLASGNVQRGYASGTSSTRTTGLAADAKKGVSTLNTAVNKLYSIITKAFTSGRIGSGTANNLNKWLDKQNKSLQKMVADRATIATKLKDANAKLADVKAQESEMATSISDKATQERSLTGLFNTEGVSVSSAISGLKERLTSIKSFQSNISALVKRGFSKEIIAEIADAGPVDGGAIAKEMLTATDTQVKDFNSTYQAIGTASTSLGKSVATSYYATGKAAAQALVNGLMADDKKLTKGIEKLADLIERKFKKRLKISSKTPVDSSLASLLTWLTGQGQAVKGGGSTSKKKTTRTTTTYSTDSQGRKVTTVTTSTTDPAKGTTTTVTKRTVGGKTTTSTRVSKIKGYATGTRSAAPGVALVGEKGPELINFKGGERVYNDKDTANMMGPRYEIHIHEAKAENTTQAVLRAMQYAETMAAL